MSAATAARPARPSLLRHADFQKIWAAATISLLGSQVSQIAIPVIATLVLGSTPLEVALLGTIEFLPFILFTLPAGAWLDRIRRRPVLVFGDLGRAIALATIPVAFVLGHLTIWQLYVVGFTTGTLTVLFDVADQSYLPALLDREDLVEGNAKLQLSVSAAQMVGQGLGGGLIAIVGAPFAVIADAVSFVVSGGLIAMIRRPEPHPERQRGPDGERRSLRQEIAEGLRYVLGNRYLRMIAGCTGTSNLFGNLAFAVTPILLYREVGLSPAVVGVVFGLANAGFLLGAALASRLPRRFGLGPVIVFSSFVGGPAVLLVAFIPSTVPIAAAMLFISGFVSGWGQVVYNVNQVSYRQAITPPAIQGRMNATMRFIVWGTIPIGSILGGIIATLLSVRGAVLIGGLGSCLAFLWVLFSPVRALREMPSEDVGQERRPVAIEIGNAAPSVTTSVAAETSAGESAPPRHVSAAERSAGRDARRDGSEAGEDA